MKAKILLGFLILTAGTASQAAFINDPAPFFSLKKLDGTEVKLQDMRGQVVLVNFWASWCPPCKMEFPELNELANEYEGLGVKVLAVNLDKSPDRVEKFLEKTRIKANRMIILLDPEAKVVADYVARSMPSSFILDKKGVIRFVHFGYSEKDPAKWRKEIESLRLESNK